VVLVVACELWWTVACVGKLLVCAELTVWPCWDLVAETVLPTDEPVLCEGPWLDGVVGWGGGVMTGRVTVEPGGTSPLLPWTADLAVWLVC
jgi:hypothetical protein